ncbi:hypothetical protein [Methanogenium cariaci]|uniref:hypothetical protein n=1 Tax=Methanogenium cariaci TaxID=2197 RepID=UPI001C44D64B|nr:hypothetical protein [Methanogenium cariaci]
MMNAKEAVAAYQFSERSKSELIAASQIVATLYDYKGAEKAAAKRVTTNFLELFRSNLLLGFNMTKNMNFQKAADCVSEAISRIEADDFAGGAGQKLGDAVSFTTTPAQEAWGFLSEHGFL